MPRVATAPRPMAAPPSARTKNARNRKPPPLQDRLTQRTLFFRRVKRSLKPGLWFLGVVSVLVMGTELIRSLPTSAPAPAPVAAAKPHHSSFGLAALAADFGLRISKVEILGAQTTDPASLQQAVGVKAGDPSLGFSLAAVQARVEQLGPVQTATVERALPGTLIVTVKERDAYAIWQTTQNGQTAFVLIDKKGHVIADQNATAAKRREPSLLLLTGADAPANAATLIAELQAAPAVLARVTAAERVGGLRWNLILKNRTVVKLPDDNENDAIQRLASLQAGMQLLDRPVEVIDLRQAGRLVVRPYPAAAPAAPPAKGGV